MASEREIDLSIDIFITKDNPCVYIHVYSPHFYDPFTVNLQF